MGTAERAWQCYAEQDWDDFGGLVELMRQHVQRALPEVAWPVALGLGGRLAEAALLADAADPAGWQSAHDAVLAGAPQRRRRVRQLA